MLNEVGLSVEFPRIGTLVTNERAVELCHCYGLDYIAHQIENSPDLYRPWTFDGVSGLPDSFMHYLGKGFDITYNCALPHDLAYGYGHLGDRLGRKLADHNFREALINKADVNPLIAYFCWMTVRVLGSERLGMSFSWGFANKNRPYLSNSPLKSTLFK